MPADEPWLTRRPTMTVAPLHQRYWHVYPDTYGPLSPNPASQARFALPESHAMFYVADSLAGVLWETVLRDVEPDANGHVDIARGKLRDLRAVPLRLHRDDLPVLELGQPGLRRLFPPGSPEAGAVAQLLHTPDHALTHPEARALSDALQAYGVPSMPMLSWPSRQLSTSTVYLAYAPPMEPDWWSVDDEPLALDDPRIGLPHLQAELARYGFTWTPLATDATVPDPKAE
jgi:hypothetical protein